MRSNFVVVGLLSAVASLQAPQVASACGCFHTVMTSASPVVQAAERILFFTESGQVTAHIQIQYSGAASDFGWLLPLPSLPTLEVGSNDLFAKLQALTDPVFTLTRTYTCQSNSTTLCAGFGANADTQYGGGGGGGAPDMGSPLVIADSIGPYDYAVLKADDATALLDWLKQNNYSTPPGSDTLVAPYIHPGAYFLALKLHAGKSAGDIQPIVVHYASDLPMIPIRLTALSAVPRMGVLVWMLGAARAIPRNYYHVVMNEGALDWTTAANYDDLLVRAIDEAPSHHAFVTEYAGTSKILVGKIPSLDQTAGLFAKYPYLTRLHTVLSPADMTADPVFSFNPDLPEVSNLRSATLAADCDQNADLITPDVTTFWRAGRPPSGLPASLRIETISEAGPPAVITNNTGPIQARGGGCALIRKGRRGGDLCLIALSVLLVRLGSRKRRGAR